MEYCTIIEGHFVLHGKDGFEYDIGINRIKNEADLIAWIVHITEKDWVHSEMVREFVLTVCGQKGWKCYGV